MKNQTRRFLTSACALALSANSLVVFGQDKTQPNKTQEPAKTIERSVWVDGNGQTFNVRVPDSERGVFTTSASASTIGFMGNGNGQDGYTFSFMASEVGTTNKVVKGAPYSAEVVTEFVQTLADGNRIVRRNTSNVYRDGQGRTRNEQGMAPMGLSTFASGENIAKTSFITDPVEGVTFMLDDKARIARRSRQGGMAMASAGFKVTADRPNVEPPKKINVSGGVLQGSALKKVQPAYPAEAKAAKASGPVQVQISINETGEVIATEVVSGHPLLRDAATTAARQWQFKPTELSGSPVKVQGVLTFNFTLADEYSATSAPASGGDPASPVMRRVTATRQNVNTTALGKQMIEGVECEGTRFVQTIPAGQIGNEQAIEIVSERWFSPELQLVVLSKLSDPRNGETTVRMANILRLEPDEMLFKVPSDYTIKEENQVFMRTTKPE